MYINAYKVQYWNETGDMMEETDVPASQCSFKVESLKANTEYQFQVAAVWETHCGPFSEVFRFKTLGGEYFFYLELDDNI